MSIDISKVSVEELQEALAAKAKEGEINEAIESLEGLVQEIGLDPIIQQLTAYLGEYGHTVKYLGLENEDAKKVIEAEFKKSTKKVVDFHAEKRQEIADAADCPIEDVQATLVEHFTKHNPKNKKGRITEYTVS